MEHLDIVNKRLLDNYGLGVSEQQRYRVVFSTAQREVRTGLFTKHYGEIYLGEAVLTQEVEKYPMFVDYWILEHVLPNLGNPELHASISYEPLWIFQDRNGQPLPYDWEVIEKIIYFHQHGSAPQSDKDIEHDANEMKLKEAEETLDFLQHDGALPNRMYDTPLITVPGRSEDV